MMGTKLLDKLRRRESSKPYLGAGSHYERGLEFEAQSLHAKAVEEFKQAIQKKPDFAEAYLKLGTAYRLLGRFDDALEAGFAALEICPDLIEAYRNLGLAYDSAGDFVQAFRMYTKAIRLK